MIVLKEITGRAFSARPQPQHSDLATKTTLAVSPLKRALSRALTYF
jgi:hypothetical protein